MEVPDFREEDIKTSQILNKAIFIENEIKIEMEAFVERMIDEHKVLFNRIKTLEAFIYSDKSDKINRVEFANMCIQLKAMRIYEEALRARLVNHGIIFENDTYFKPVDGTYVPPKGCCEECSEECFEHQCGSDFDADTEHISHSGEIEPNSNNNNG